MLLSLILLTKDKSRMRKLREAFFVVASAAPGAVRCGKLFF